MMLPNNSESDLRACYCGAAIHYLLTYRKPNLKIGFDKHLLANYINQCRSGSGFGSIKNWESHSGLTYCAVAALTMLEQPVLNKEQLLEFLVMR